MNNESYRVDECGSVYEYDLGSYWFIGKLNGETLDQFLFDYYNETDERNDS